MTKKQITAEYESIKKLCKTEGFVAAYGDETLNLETLFTYAEAKLRFSEPLRLRVENDAQMVSANITEAFECCGKAYLYSFTGYTHDADNYKKMCKLFLTFASFFARLRGYSYIGFVHKKSNLLVSSSEEVGFKKAVEFHNPRSGNQLCEMYKILD